MSLTEFYKKQSPSTTLCRQEFLSSGTFIMPAGVIDNQILVATTGGGGAGLIVKHKPSKPSEALSGRGGGGSGVRYTQLTMQEGDTAAVLVGGSVASAYSYRNRHAFNLSSSPGGTSSFTGAESCPGGRGVTVVKELEFTDATISGGGNGKEPTNEGTEYSSIFQCTGGAGPYGKASVCADSLPNTGAGAGEAGIPNKNWKSGSGRVIVFYYKRNELAEEHTHGDPTSDIQYAIINDNNIVENIIVVPSTWNGAGINLSESRAEVLYVNITDDDLKQVPKIYRSVGIGDTYNQHTNAFISSSLTIDFRWNKEQNDRLKYLLNQ